MSIYSIKQFSMRYPAFSESALRRLIAKADENGFDMCVIRPPGIKRVYIDEQKFLMWLNSGEVNQIGDENNLYTEGSIRVKHSPSKLTEIV